MKTQNQWTGVRAKTYNERLKIGFTDVKTKWSSAPALFTDKTLQICGHPVMEDWEDNYMKILADIATLNGKTVLEVGFGMGLSARHIQKTKINLHIIMEANFDVYQKLLDFAKTEATSKVKPLFGFWEDTIKTLKDNSVSGILFDTYPLDPTEVHCNHFNFFKEAYRILKKDGILTYYSDEIRSFSEAHIACLKRAGFKKITGKLCRVTPPDNCQYWKSRTILAPIIIK